MRTKEAKGITLVALVVTIIILLILAGVALAFTFGNDGIINKSKEAVQKHNQAVGNEEIQLGEVEKILDSYLSGSSSEADYVTLDFQTFIGKFFRQKSDYLSIRIDITEPTTNAKLTIPVGTDWDKHFEISDTNNVFGKSQENTLEMVTDFTKDGGYSKDNAKIGYSVINCFTDVNFKWKVKKGMDYKIEITGKATTKNEANQTIAKDVNLYTGTTGILTTDTSIKKKKNESNYTESLDVNGDGKENGTDANELELYIKGNYDIPSTQIFKTSDLANKEISVVSLMSPTGTIQPGMENFIGLDINRDGFIDQRDVVIIQSYVGFYY